MDIITWQQAIGLLENETGTALTGRREDGRYGVRIDALHAFIAQHKATKPSVATLAPLQATLGAKLNVDIVCLGVCTGDSISGDSYKMYYAQKKETYYIPKSYNYFKRWLPSGEAVVSRQFLRMRERHNEALPWRELTPDEEEDGAA